MATRLRLHPSIGYVTLLFALTGGFGLLVPGLSGCDYQVGRLLWAALIGMSVVPFLAVCAARSKTRGASGSGSSPSGRLAVVLNTALGHDPVCAVLNWRIDRMAFEQTDEYRHWQVVTPIANHEQVIHTPEAGFSVQQGA